jgi:DNA modification methylase
MSPPKLFGVDLFGNPLEQKLSVDSVLKTRFLVPPFSVLDTRAGDWQERKRAWLRTGIKSEVGRGKDGAEFVEHESGKKCIDGLTFRGTGFLAEEMQRRGGGTSVFDPVLCEVAYRWWCPPGGQVLDPFAGGSVRGIVAASLGHPYWGCDLSVRQVAANREQAGEILGAAYTPTPVWVCGDSAERLVESPWADFIFTCPPYGDLEKYSDDPKDLSNMDAGAFLQTYRRIILRSVKKLRNNSFACFCVGDYRGKDGRYMDFVSKTIQAFLDCGCCLYNEAILLNSVGTAAIRASHQFLSGRKLCKVHQNVLVFCKGDWKEAAKKIITKEEEKCFSQI